MYILLCADGSYYTGNTKDLRKRMQEHQSGQGAEYTSSRLPVQLLYYEEYRKVSDAFDREKQIQRWSRKKKDALIEGNLEELSKAAKKIFRKPGGRALGRACRDPAVSLPNRSPAPIFGAGRIETTKIEK
jgi:putative endonuclease